MKLNNRYFLSRHGEAFSNANCIVSSWPEKIKNPLTKKGVEQIKKVIEELKNVNIDLIFASDLLRAEQTAGMIGKDLDLKVKFDKRLREINFGIMSGGPAEKFVEFFKDRKERIHKHIPKGESYTDVFKRVSKFLKEIDKKYKGKNILLVSHQAPLFLLEGYMNGLSVPEIISEFPPERMLKTGTLREIKK